MVMSTLEEQNRELQAKLNKLQGEHDALLRVLTRFAADVQAAVPTTARVTLPSVESPVPRRYLPEPGPGMCPGAVPCFSRGGDGPSETACTKRAHHPGDCE